MHQAHDHESFVNKSVGGLKEVNLKVLQDPPCSVGVLVDNGPKTSLHADTNQHIYVFFFGGPDDREALILACRMLQLHGDDVKLTVIQFVTTDHNMLTSHVETKSQPRSALKCLGRKVGDFFLAPWTKTHDANGKVDVVNADGSEVHVFVDNIMFQKERNMDMQALAAATTTNFKKDEVCTKSNVTLKVIEAKNLEMSILDIVNTIQANGLIITGMQSPLVERSAFSSTLEDHGLGHLGNFLVSINTQTSLLVVQQYKPSQNDDFSRPVAEEFERVSSDSLAPSDVDASTTSDDSSESSRFK